MAKELHRARRQVRLCVRPRPGLKSAGSRAPMFPAANQRGGAGMEWNSELSGIERGVEAGF